MAVETKNTSVNLLGSSRNYVLLLALETGLWSLGLLPLVARRSQHPEVLGLYSVSYAVSIAPWVFGWLVLFVALIPARQLRPTLEAGLLWLRRFLLARLIVSLGLLLAYLALIYSLSRASGVPALILLVWFLALIVLPFCLLWLGGESLRDLGGNLLLSLTVFGIMLVLVLGLFTWLITDTEVFYNRHRYYFDLFQPDVELGKRTRPNLRDFEISWHGESGLVTTDELGFRNVHPTEGNPIAVVGDSFGFGMLVDQEETWVHQLEVQTGQPIANYSVIGYSLWEYNQLLRHYVTQRGHRLVLYTIFPNDLIGDLDAENRTGEDWTRQPSVAQYRDRRAYFVAQAKIVFTGSLSDWRSHFFSRPLVLDNGLMVTAKKKGLRPDSSYLDEGRYEAYHQRVAEAIELVRAHDMEIVVLLFPTKESVYRDQFIAALGDEGAEILRGEEGSYRLLCDFVRSLDTLCYDLTDDLRQLAQEGHLLYFERDGHWNVQGNFVVGNLVSEYLDRNGGAQKP